MVTNNFEIEDNHTPYKFFCQQPTQQFVSDSNQHVQFIERNRPVPKQIIKTARAAEAIRVVTAVGYEC